MALTEDTLNYATQADTDLLRRDLDSVEQRLNTQILRTERAIGLLYTRMNQRFDDMDAKVDQRFDDMDAKFDQRFDDMDAKFAELKELILSVDSNVDDRG